MCVCVCVAAIVVVDGLATSVDAVDLDHGRDERAWRPLPMDRLLRQAPKGMMRLLRQVPKDTMLLQLLVPVEAIHL